MRTKFDEQLEQLHVELIKMGSLCEEAISLSAEILDGLSKREIEKVGSLEHEIDQMERDIETLLHPACCSSSSLSPKIFVQFQRHLK